MTRLLRQGVFTHLLVIAVYAVLSLILSYPLVTHFNTHVMGTDIWAFDEYTFIWNMWWFKHATLDLHSNPLYSSYIFYPLGISLVLYTYNLFNALMSVPLQAFLGLPAIANLLNVFALTFSGYGTYLLLRYLLATDDTEAHASALTLHAAAFIGGLIYAFGSFHFIYAALGHYDMVSTQWIPFYTLFVVKTVRESGRRNPILAGVFATFALLGEMIFGVFLAFLTVIVVVFAGARRVLSLEFGKRFGLLLLTTLATYFWVGIPILGEFLNREYALEGWGHSEKLAVDLFGFTTPTALHPLLGRDWTEELTMVREGTARFVDVNTVFLGWVVLIMALWAGVRYWRRTKAWAVGALTSAVLAMGPLLHVNGRSTFDLDGLAVNVPLPFIVLHYIPVIRANRVPNRFSAMLMLCMAILAGFTALAILRRFSRQKVLLGVGGLLGLLILAEHLAVPVPLTDATPPDWYYNLAEEPGDFAILEFPLGWRNSFGVLGVERTQAQYYQSVHQKRLPSGNISRNPSFKFDYFRRIPIFDSIARLELYEQLDPARIELDKAQAAELAYFFDIRYLVFQPIIPNRPPYSDTRPEVEEYAQLVFPLEGIYQDASGLTVYRVSQPAPLSRLSIDFGTDGATLYQADGWSHAEVIGDASANWVEGRRAEIFVPLREVGDYEMTFRALSFAFEASPQQTVSVTLNGHRLPAIVPVGPYWEVHSLTLPSQHVRPGLNKLVLEFGYAASPRDVLPANFVIGDTGVTSPLEITVNSAGLHAGDFAYITVGEEDASTHRRGYNVAVIDPRSGAVVDKAGFDTYANEYESQDLADFVAEIPEGYIVAVAVKDDGAAHLTTAAVRSLQTLGATSDLRGSEHRSHAIIGVKGAAPGTALEASGEGNSYLHVGRNPDERRLSVALDYVDFNLR